MKSYWNNKIKEIYVKMIRQEGTPESIARGVAIGTFYRILHSMESVGACAVLHSVSGVQGDGGGIHLHLQSAYGDLLFHAVLLGVF